MESWEHDGKDSPMNFMTHSAHFDRPPALVLTTDILDAHAGQNTSLKTKFRKIKGLYLAEQIEKYK